MMFRPPRVCWLSHPVAPGARCWILFVILTILAVAPETATATATMATATTAAGIARQEAATVPSTAVGALAVDDQVRWLQRAARDDTLAQLDDTKLVALFASLDPRALVRYIAAGPNGYDACEFTMRHRERIGGRWPKTPDHVLVRLAHDPLRLYARWLPDGAHAGQEVLYDAARRGDAMYGHAGGVFGVVSMWTRLDGAFARSQSHHRLTDLGTESIARQFLADFPRLAGSGAAKPSQVAVQTRDGVRVVALTWDAPADASGLPASRETLGLDLRHPWFRTVQSYDGAGRLIEDVVIEHIEPKTFDALTFDASNPDYRF